MNDKAKVAIGESGVPESAASHNFRALTGKRAELSMSDHNHNFASAIPSVTLLCEILELASLFSTF